MTNGGRGIGRKAATGFAWATAGTIGAKVFSLVALAFLARLLAPAEFGLFAVALVYLTYMETIGDLGTGMALMYWPDRVRDAAQVTFAVNLAMGVTLTVATMVWAPVVAAFFQSPEATPVLRVLALSFALRAAGNTHDALCRKQLRFKARLWPELGLAGVKAVIAVTLAALGFGVWSLVWGQLAGVAIWSALLWAVVPWRPGWRWPRGLARPMLRYAAGIVAVNLVAVVTHHADSVVVGRVLGATALGFYQMGTRLPEMLVALVVWQAGKVLFPAFTKVRAAGGDIRAAYLTSLRYLSLAAGPLAVGMAMLAEPVVRIAFGEVWLPSVPILQALAIYAGVRAIGSPTGDVLKAAGRPGLLAMSGVLKAIVLVPALLYGARHGAAGVAAALMAVSFAVVLLNLGMARVLVGVRIRAIVASFRESGPATLALAAVLWLWPAQAQPAVAGLLAPALVGAGVAVMTVRAVSPSLFAEVSGVLRGQRDGSRVAVEVSA